MFEVRIRLTEHNNGYMGIEYETIEQCLDDYALEALFNDNLVTKCEIFQGDRRIAGIPLMRWDRFKSQLVESSRSILEGAG